MCIDFVQICRNGSIMKDSMSWPWIFDMALSPTNNFFIAVTCWSVSFRPRPTRAFEFVLRNVTEFGIENPVLNELIRFETSYELSIP
jgi:hypothetical protein